MSTDVMIYANDLSKTFGSFRALDKVNFEVRKGEIVGFLGPNGAGKSTTMRILTCFIAPTGGVAKVRGYDVFDNPLEVRESLGYLPQRAPLYLEMTVLEYLKFAADLRKVDPSTFRTRARNAVEVCGLAQVLNKEIRALSHGYRQRVGLAQALIHDPPILVLDEPTADLDPNEKAEFLDYLKQIGKDRTVLLSTHILAEVEAACSRAIIVSRGRVVADGQLDEIRAKSGRVSYVVSIREDAAAQQESVVEGALRSVKGVEKIVTLPTDDKAHAFELTSTDDVDLRADIFQMIVQKGWTMLELHRDTQTLEDVFRDLTVGDARRNRNISATAARDDESDDDDDEDDDDDSEDAGAEEKS